MKCVKVVSAVCLGGGVDVYPGRILTVPGDISEKAARVKIAQGFMVECDAPPLLAPTADLAPDPFAPTGGIETNGDPLPVDRDPRPRRGRASEAR